MTRAFIAAQCPSCGARSEQVPASLAGKTVRCPRCATTFRVDAETRFDEPAATTPEVAPATLAPAREQEWRVGETIAGLYEITGVLGQGGMGRVYRARHRDWDLDLAIKTPLARALEASGGAAAFEREAETWVNLGLHPHVVTCYYVRRLDGAPRLFAEFVDGGSLLEWIRDGRLVRLADVLDVAVQFAWGLHYAHEQGLVHRDVKPANVLLTSGGEVKVTDFGLARAGRLDLPAAAPSGASVAVAGGIAGTPAYMSPEQLAGETLTRRSDLWSFALSVLEMFAGSRNWDYGTAAPEVLRELVARPASGRVPLPEAVASLLARCFESDPERRPHDLTEVAAVLVEAYETATGRAYPRVAPRASRGSADNLNNRGVSLLDLMRPREAVELWERALAVEPQHLEATFNRALHEWSDGRLDDAEAERLLAEAVKSHGGDARGAELLASFRLAAGEVAREDRAASTLVPEAFTRKPGAGDVEATLRGLSGAATALAATRSGSEVVAGGGGREARVWDAASGALKRKIVSDEGRPRALAVTPDGRLLLWAAEDAPLRVFELASGRLVRTLPRTAGAALSLAVSPDGRQAVVGSSDRTVRVFDIEHGTLRLVLEGHEDGVFAVAVSDTRIASGSRDGSVRVWDAATGVAQAVHRGHQGRVNAVLLDEHGGRVFSGGEDRTVRAWPDAAHPETRVFHGATQPVSALAFSPGGRRLVAASLDRGVRLYDLEQDRLFAMLRLDSAVHALCCTEAGLIAAHGSQVSRLAVPERSRLPHPVLVRPLAASAVDTRQVEFDAALQGALAHRDAGDLDKAVDALRAARSIEGHARADAALRLWDELAADLPRSGLRGAWEERVATGHVEAVLAVAVSTAGRIASAGLDRTIRLLSLDPALAPTILARLDAPVASLAFLPQGNRLVSGGRDNSVRVWDVATGALAATALGHEGYVAGVAAAGDGARLASASLDQTLRVWSASGEHERTLPGHRGGAAAVAFSPDGRVLVSAGWDGAVRTWNPDTGTGLAELQGHAGNVNSVAVSPQGLGLASGGADGSVRVWDAQARKQSALLKGHEAEVTAVAFLADGRWLVSASRDGSARVWNAATGRCERVLSHGCAVLGVALATRGERLVTACADGSVRVWHLDWELERPEARLRFKPQTLRTSEEAVAAVAAPSAPAWEDVRRTSTRQLLQRPVREARSVPWRRVGFVALALAVVGLSVRAWLGRATPLHLVPHVVSAVNSEPDLIRLDAFRDPCDAGDVNVYLERVRATEVSAPDLACLANSHDPAVVAPYLSTLTIEDADLYRATRLSRNAISLLAGLGEPAAPTLCGFLGDGRDAVRQVVATALAVSNTPAARGCLLRTMTGGDVSLARATAVSTLTRLLAQGDPDVSEGARLVKRLLADADPAVRVAALGVLPIFDQAFARPLAEAARSDTEAGVRGAAEQALRGIAAVRQGEALDGQP